MGTEHDGSHSAGMDSVADTGRFRISPQAALSAELCRVADAEIDAAIAEASSIPGHPARSVHECRKAIKRLRALAQLGRGQKGKHWKQPDRSLRNAGRLLAEARDADVLTRTVAELRGAKAILHRPRLEGDGKSPGEEMTEAVVGLLEKARVELEALFVEGEWSIDRVCRAIDKSYRRTRGPMKRFRRHGAETDAHDWRKGVQRYANQLRLLRSFSPVESRDELESLDKLAKSLGDYNDLTVLRAAAESGWARAGRKATAKLIKSARSRQRELRDEALSLGTELFAGDRPSIDVSAAAAAHREQARSEDVESG
jgi:CHAD domain-containing protein